MDHNLVSTEHKFASKQISADFAWSCVRVLSVTLILDLCYSSVGVQPLHAAPMTALLLMFSVVLFLPIVVFFIIFIFVIDVGIYRESVTGTGC